MTAKQENAAWGSIWVLLMGAAIIFAGHARSQERDLSNVQTGNIIMCDTADDVRKVVGLIESGVDMEDAFDAVETTDTACAQEYVAFISGDRDGDTFPVRKGIVEVLSIEVVALANENGSWSTLDPAVRVYTVHYVAKGQGV